jgi:hypothetical protein
MTNASELITREEADAELSMNEELSHVCSEIRRRYKDQMDDHLRFYRWLGSKAAQLQEDVTTYGSNAINVISQQLQVAPAAIYKSIAFHNRYTEDDLDRLMRMSQNIPGRFKPIVSWSHITHLVSIEDKKRRIELEDALIENNWSVQELQDAIKQEFGAARKAGAGRPIKAPTNLRGSMTAASKTLETLITKTTAIWGNNTGGHRFVDFVEAGTPDKLKVDVQEFDDLIFLGEQAMASARQIVQEAKAGRDALEAKKRGTVDGRVVSSKVTPVVEETPAVEKTTTKKKTTAKEAK